VPTSHSNLIVFTPPTAANARRPLGTAGSITITTTTSRQIQFASSCFGIPPRRFLSVFALVRTATVKSGDARCKPSSLTARTNLAAPIPRLPARPGPQMSLTPKQKDTNVEKAAGAVVSRVYDGHTLPRDYGRVSTRSRTWNHGSASLGRITLTSRHRQSERAVSCNHTPNPPLGYHYSPFASSLRISSSGRRVKFSAFSTTMILLAQQYLLAISFF